MIFFNQGMLLLVFTLPYIASWLWVDSNCPIVDLLQLAIFFFRSKLYCPSKPFSLSGYLAQINQVDCEDICCKYKWFLQYYRLA